MGIPINQDSPCSSMNWDCATLFLICLRQSMLVSQACLWQLFDLTQQNTPETEYCAFIALDTPFWQSCAVGNSWLWWKCKTGGRESKTFGSLRGLRNGNGTWPSSSQASCTVQLSIFFLVLLKKCKTSMKNTTVLQPLNSSQLTRLSSMQEVIF